MNAERKRLELKERYLGQSQDGWEKVREVHNTSWLAQCFLSATQSRSSNTAEQAWAAASLSRHSATE